jgi:hypothetical protein
MSIMEHFSIIEKFSKFFICFRFADNPANFFVFFNTKLGDTCLMFYVCLFIFKDWKSGQNILIWTKFGNDLKNIINSKFYFNIFKFQLSGLILATLNVLAPIFETHFL